MKLSSIKLRNVAYMPKELEPGILYAALEFGAVAHLCACGCGTKIRTPLGVTEWSLREGPQGPTLRPSVGNWQQPCRSHYLITNGEIEWAGQWTAAQIAAGRKREEDRRAAHYEAKYAKQRGILVQFWNWLKKLLGL